MGLRRSPVVLNVCVLIAFAAVALFGAGPESASAAGGVALSSIAAGHAHNCAVSAQGAVSCWGNNGVGQVGDGTTSFFREPAQVTDLASGVAELAAGAYHTCALTTGGGIKCWGSDQYGQLGAEATELCGPGSTGPLDVSGLGSGRAPARRGGATGWGPTTDGQLGNGTSGPGQFSAVPVDVLDLGSGVSALSLG